MRTMQSLRTEKWMSPVWSGKRIWEESVCFFEDALGDIKGGKLLYTPNKITRVINHDASIVYEEHIDYEVTQNGICLTEGSNIPVLKRDTYVGVFTGEPGTDWLCLPDKEHYIHIFPDIIQFQILVTYETDSDGKQAQEDVSRTAWTGCVADKQGAKLVNTYDKLDKGEPLHVVFYGDSITAGWEASGADEWAVDMYSLEPMKIHFERYPKMPVWAQLVVEQLRNRFPNADITKDNLSAGGSTARWGIEHVNELFDRVTAPDLVFVGFGMNCMWDAPEVFIGYIKDILEELRKRNPDCEFVLYPAMVANPEMAAYQHDNMKLYEAALEEFAANQPGVIVAPVHSMFRELMNRGKEYYEISGNAVNHPNDFSVRVYAQVIWETMCR